MRIIDLSRFSSEDLNPGEEIIMTPRIHWLFLLWYFLQNFFLVFLTLFIGYLLLFYNLVTPSLSPLDLVVILIWSFLLLYLLLVKVLNTFIQWKYSLKLITNERVISVKQNYLFGKDIYYIELDKVEKIELEHKDGLLGTIFDFADIYIYTAVAATAGQRATLIMKGIWNPEKVNKTIGTAIRELRLEESGQKRPRPFLN